MPIDPTAPSSPAGCLRQSVSLRDAEDIGAPGVGAPGGAAARGAPFLLLPAFPCAAPPPLLRRRTQPRLPWVFFDVRLREGQVLAIADIAVVKLAPTAPVAWS